MTWHHAKDYCRAQWVNTTRGVTVNSTLAYLYEDGDGGVLVSLHETNDARSVWVGGNDLVEEGEWVRDVAWVMMYPRGLVTSYGVISTSWMCPLPAAGQEV
jgi:hypothetical protein